MYYFTQRTVPHFLFVGAAKEARVVIPQRSLYDIARNSLYSRSSRCW